MATIVMIFLLLFVIGAHHARSFSPHPTAAAFRSPLKSSLHKKYQGPGLQIQTSFKGLSSSSVESTDHDDNANFNHNHNDNVTGYFIQHVITKARALDMEVFRGSSSVTAQEFVTEQQQSGNDISEDEAVDLLTENYDEDGNYMYNAIPQYEPETYFVAVYNDTNVKDEFARQNGIIGVVSAQLRRRSPLIAGPSIDDDSDSTVLPSVPIPSPHVYIANMLVHDKMQRKGVGMALLSSMLEEYATSWSIKMQMDLDYENENEKIPLVLSVDNDNVGAIRLYEKFGFEYLEENDVFCMMILWP